LKILLNKGPGKNNNNFQNAWIIGKRQFQASLKLFYESSIEISGPIEFRNTFVDFGNITIDKKYMPNNNEGRTCLPASKISTNNKWDIRFHLEQPTDKQEWEWYKG
jgi:hypothetical protein